MSQLVKGKQPLNVLIAYPYFSENWIEFLRKTPKEDYRLIVDSGAFSAWNTGLQIDLDEYCRFLDAISDLRPFHAVQLDVYGDPHQSYQNFLTMNKRGYDVMPVFTRGETSSRLEDLYSYTDYIMFGGIAIGGKNDAYLRWFMNQNGKRRVHWLGFTNTSFVKYYRPESVDSSSWNSLRRFGNMAVYDPKTMRITNANKNQFIEKPDKELVDKLLKVGATWEDVKKLGKSDAWRTSISKHDIKNTADRINNYARIKQALDLERMYGTKIFLACAMPHYVLEFLFDCFYEGRDKGLW